MPVLPYAVLDVFAERPLEGNPLAVFADGRDLSTERMQAIARELNLSETTFVLPRDPELERREGVRVRIFTPREELPFAGHPTLGTASWLREHHPAMRDAAEVTLALNVGPIRVTFAPEQSAGPGVFATMEQMDPVFGAPSGAPMPTAGQLAEVLAVGAEEIGLADRPEALPEVVSTGNPFLVVPLHSMRTAATLSLRHDRAEAMLEQLGARFFYCVTRATGAGGAEWHGRMQWYGGEDPATGSAAGCVAAWLVRHGLVGSGCLTALEQGVEIGRPSRLVLEASLIGGRVRGVRVGGRTIPVATGHLFLP